MDIKEENIDIRLCQNQQHCKFHGGKLVKNSPTPGSTSGRFGACGHTHLPTPVIEKLPLTPVQTAFNFHLKSSICQ